jgi:chromosome segregation ATPase
MSNRFEDGATATSFGSLPQDTAMPDYIDQLEQRVQQQARELQRKHAEVNELIDYKVLCERRLVELHPTHNLPVTKGHLGSETAAGFAGGGATPSVKSAIDGKLPTHVLSALAQKQREYDELLSRYNSLQSHGERIDHKLSERELIIRNLKGALESREKECQASVRKAQSMSHRIEVMERHSRANEEYISKMQRKFSAGAKGSYMLKKNAVLKQRLDEVEAHNAKLDSTMKSEQNEKENRIEYIEHLRKALEMKSADLGLKPGQSSILEDFLDLRERHREALQELASYEDRGDTQSRTIQSLREQVSELRAAHAETQAATEDAIGRAEKSRKTCQAAYDELHSVRSKAEKLQQEKSHLVDYIQNHMDKQSALEEELQECRRLLNQAEERAAGAERIKQERDSIVEKVRKLQASIAPLEAEARGRQVELHELSQHLRAKADEVAEATAIQAELLQAVGDTKREKQELLAQHTSLAGERAQENLRYQKLQREMDDLTAQQAELLQAVGDAKREKQELLAQHTGLEDERTQESLRYQKLQREMDDLTAQQADLLQAVGDAKREKQELLAQHTGLEGERTQDGLRYQKLQRETEEMAAEMRRSRDEAAQLRTEVDSLCARLADASNERDTWASASSYIDSKIDALRASMKSTITSSGGALNLVLGMSKEILQLEQELQMLATVIGGQADQSQGRGAGTPSTIHSVHRQMDAVHAKIRLVLQQCTRVSDLSASSTNALDAAELRFREAENRAQSLQETVANMSAAQELLRQEATGLKDENAEIRVDMTLLNKLEHEYVSNRKLFDSKLQLQQSRLDALIAEKTEIQTRCRELQNEADGSLNALSEQQIASAREREVLERNHQSNLAQSAELQKTVQELQGTIRQQTQHIRKLEATVAQREAEVKQMEASREAAQRLQIELTETREHLNVAMESRDETSAVLQELIDSNERLRREKDELTTTLDARNGATAAAGQRSKFLGAQTGGGQSSVAFENGPSLYVESNAQRDSAARKAPSTDMFTSFSSATESRVMTRTEADESRSSTHVSFVEAKLRDLRNENNRLQNDVNAAD